MKLPALFTTDLHLTANPADEYRWALFPWLVEQARRYRVRSVAILGDLTDAKDYHSSVLVNRVVASIEMLTKAGLTVDILQGNHDYLKDGNPFFSFLSSLPGVRFITKVTSDHEENLQCLWLPHSKNPVLDWADLQNFSWYSFIFMHQTFNGSVASNGQEMAGDGVEKLEWFNRKLEPQIWSGDIHVPQKLGLIEYVGSPYPVHFGDHFKARVILLEQGGRRSNLYFPCAARMAATVHGLRGFRNLQVTEGDQVKLKVVLAQSEQQDWPSIRKAAEQWADSKGVNLLDIKLEVDRSSVRLESHGIQRTTSPEEALCEFVNGEDLGADALEAGLEILES